MSDKSITSRQNVKFVLKLKGKFKI